MTCVEVLEPILADCARRNAQFPLLLFSEPNCQGDQFPPVGGLTPLNTAITPQDIGLERIGSVYIPSNLELQLTTPDQQARYTAHGTQIIVDTRSLLTGFWEGAEGRTKIDWSLGRGRVGQIGSVFVRVLQPWSDMLASYAPKRHSLRAGPLSFEVDFVTLFADRCGKPQPPPECGCYLAHQRLLEEHPAAASDSYVNLTQNGCNPLTHFVPDGARVARGFKSECLQMIRAQVGAGSFPTLTHNGPSNYVCNNQLFPNAYHNGDLDALARWDDKESAEAEVQEMRSPLIVWVYVLVGVVGAVLLLALWYWCFTVRRFSPAITHVRRHRFRERWG